MNPTMINLGLAIFWLFLGGSLLLFEWITGEPVGRFRLPLGRLNPGWLALLFGVYNLYRVYSIRSYQRRREAERAENDALRRKWERREEPRRDDPPNPDFMFTDTPRTEPEPPKPN